MFGNYSFGLESFVDQRIHSKFVSLLTQDKRGDLLDVGAGTGALSKKMQNEGFDVLNIPIPFQGLFFGQCIVVKMRRKTDKESDRSRVGKF